jgi:hypothetical protein
MLQTYTELIAAIKGEFPDFKLKEKSNSTLMQIVNVLLHALTFGYMDEFMTRFITTIGNTIYVHSKWYTSDLSDEEKIVILRHERVHMRQRRKYGSFLYTLMYVFLPFPCVFSYYRMKFEQEAYEETFRAQVDYFPNANWLGESFHKKWIMKYFVSAEYFWMWPFKKSVSDWYDSAVEKALCNRSSKTIT